MDSTAQDVVRFVKDNDVKFIRLAFCDLLGNLKNAAILPDELENAFCTGIAADAAPLAGFADAGGSELFLFPDAATLSVLPWRPQTGRVMRLFCFLRTADGAPFCADGRHILQSTVQRLSAAGYECRMSAQCEFYLFLRDGQGRPTQQPQDEAGYLDVAPLDGGENVRREICLTLEEMNLRPSTSHHERGPGQNEIDFRRAAPLTAADDAVTFKQVVRTVAANSGLFASFGPQPLAERPGSGMHVRFSLIKNGQNLFARGADGRLSAPAAAFLAGVLARAPELCAFTNPVPDSYARIAQLRNGGEAGGRLIRLPAVSVPERACLEVRLPDAACAPHLAFALLLAAGIEGMEAGLGRDGAAPRELLAADTRALGALPGTLEEALELAAHSDLAARVLSPRVRKAYLDCKAAELRRYAGAADQEAYRSAVYFPVL